MRDLITAKICEEVATIPDITVYQERYEKFRTEELPAMTVKAQGDDAQKNKPENVLRRTEKIVIEIYTTGQELQQNSESGFIKISSKIQAFVKEVEEKLVKDRNTLGGLVDGENEFFRLEYRGAVIGELPDTGEDLMMIAVMSFDGVWDNVLQP